MMRKVLLICLAICLIFICFAGFTQPAQAAGGETLLRFVVGQTAYEVNGERHVMDTAPVIYGGRTLLPIRFVAEPLGANVLWEAAQRKVTITFADKVIELWIGQAAAKVNGTAVPIDPTNPEVKPLILNNRTMLPLRFVSENLGAAVDWHESDRSIVVARVSGEEEILPVEEEILQEGEGPGPAEPLRPVITLFDAEPGSIVSGASTTLSWEVLNAAEVTLNDETVSAAGSRSVSPTATTAYTLRATSESGEAAESTETVIVTASLLPRIPGKIILPRLPLPGGIIIPEVPEEEAAEPTPMPGEVITAIQQVFKPVILPTIKEPIYVKIMLDSLYCMNESDWDHATNSDEPYLVVTGFTGNTEPNSWSAGIVGAYSDVDAGENRRIDSGLGRVVFDGEVSPDSSIGFNVVAMEADECPGSTRSEISDKISSGLEDVLDAATGVVDLGLADDLQGLIVRGVSEVLGELFSTLYCLLGGGADDFVANETVTFGYDNLCAWAEESNNRAVALYLDGGGSGRYILRFHLEFEQQASQSFNARFTGWDDFAVGNLQGDAQDEVLIVDEDAVGGNDGRYYIYNGAGSSLESFVAFYTHFDRVAIGDVIGDGYEEIIHACDDDDGWIRIYNTSGTELGEFPRFRPAKFTHYDGLAVGNVSGDDKAEILVACDDDRKVYLYGGNGAVLGNFNLTWDFKGCRYLDNDSRDDVFLVGDVAGDAYAEIVMIDCNGAHSKVYVYDASGTQLYAPFEVFFTPNDAATLADLTGDAKKELVVAADEGDGQNGYVNRIYDCAGRVQIGTRFWPCFTNYDGFAAGDVLGTGKDQLLLSTDEDDRVYIAK